MALRRPQRSECSPMHPLPIRLNPPVASRVDRPFCGFAAASLLQHPFQDEAYLRHLSAHRIFNI